MTATSVLVFLVEKDSQQTWAEQAYGQGLI